MRPRPSEARLAIACAAVNGVTLLSWWPGMRHGTQAFSLNTGITVGVLVIAALKVRVIVWEFMELRHAPALTRRIADPYLGVVMTLLLSLYFIASRVSG